MQGIEFETEQSPSSKSSQREAKQSFMVRFLMKLGVPDVVTANYILLGIATLFFGIAIFLSRGMFRESQPVMPTPEGQWFITEMMRK